METRRAPDLASARFERRDLGAAERAHLKASFGSKTWSLDSPGVGPDGERPPPRYVQTGVGPPLRLISDVLGAVGDGKEATAYGCRGSAEAPFGLALAKVYRAQRFRSFADAAVYRAGEDVRDRRAAKAMAQKTGRGRAMSHHVWVDREWETLCELHDAGADVPTPYARTRDAILMEYLGDERGPAPLLLRCRLDADRARRIFERLLANVELFLSCDRVHGDLSAYNALYHRDRVWVIDFPQSVDARRNPNARDLLLRDVRNLARHFERYGIRHHPEAHARALWSRYRRAQL